MSYKRPGALTAAAIISVIYGAFCIVSGLCVSTLMIVQSQGGGNGGPEAAIQEHIDECRQREIPGYQAFIVGSLVVGFVEALMLLISGLGLFAVKPWARTLALLGACISITTSILGSIHYVVYVFPVTRQAFADMPAAMDKKEVALPPGLLDFLEIFVMGAEILSVIFSLLMIVPMVIIIVLLTRAHVVAAFNNPVPADVDEHRRDFDDDLEYRRRQDDRYYDVDDEYDRRDDRFR